MKAFLYAYSQISLAEVPQARLIIRVVQAYYPTGDDIEKAWTTGGPPCRPSKAVKCAYFSGASVSNAAIPLCLTLPYPASFLHNHSTSHKVFLTIVAFIFHANAANRSLSFCNLSHLLTIQSGHLYTEANSRKPGLRL
jgi:hypothetical protein